MDIVEQMRSFESDHEPDGWPAIQMKQVSALCDEIDRLQSLLNGIASEVERLQSLLEQERQESLTASCRVAALEIELDSAKSIIDAANAQEPKECVSSSNKSIIESLIESARCMGVMIEDNGAHKYWREKVEEYRAKTYSILDSANPIPAQQLPSEHSDGLPFVPWSKEKEFIESIQQSLAVVVPEVSAHIWYYQNHERCECSVCNGSAREKSEITHLDECFTPSPRITEQDALPAGYREEWKRNVMLMWSCVRKHDSSIPSDVLDYMREQLLNKLNEAKHD